MEFHRTPRDNGEDGVWRSDGYIYFAYFAVLKAGGRA